MGDLIFFDFCRAVFACRVLLFFDKKTMQGIDRTADRNYNR